MDTPQPQCPVCHVPVRPTDYYCYNCGRNLRPAPPPTDASRQLSLYLGSLLLPPMGIIWGIRYLQGSDQKTRTIGLVCIGLTVASILLGVILAVQTINTINEQVNQQLQGIQGL